jgi:lipid-binding SYLF domain-containing protein
MSKTKWYFKLSVFLLVFAIGLPGFAKDRKQARADIPKDAQDQYERAQKAADVIGELTRTPETGIPRYLLDRAYGIAVIPHVVKAALGVGGRWGKGVISVRENSKWGTPAFIDLTGGSFGFQIGGQATDVVLVFTSRKGVDSLMSSKVKLGADASIAAGPVGRTAEAGTDLKLNAEVYAYSRSKGLFAGIALDGAVIDFDDSANRKVYNMEGKEVLSGKTATSPVTMPFTAALQAHSPSRTK